jgi:hypothetical protein
MKKGLITLAAVSAVSVLCLLIVTSCGRRPPLPPDDYPDSTISTTATTTAVTTTAPTETTTTGTMPTTLPPPTTSQEERTTTTSSSAQANYNYDGKHYTYSPPDYSGLNLEEAVEYKDSGRIWAYSHLTDDDYPAGFVIDYLPGDYLAVSYTTDESNAVYDGRHPMLEIDIDAGDGYFTYYVGETYDGNYDGEAFASDYYFEDMGWYTYVDGERNGIAYLLDGLGSAYVLEYEDDEAISETEIIPTEAGDGLLFELSSDGDLEYYADDDTMTFQRDGTPEYFAMAMFDNASYIGQISDSDFEGLGIYLWNDGDFLIAHFEDGTDTYGLFYNSDTSIYSFTKVVDGTRTLIEEIEGIDIDLDF